MCQFLLYNSLKYYIYSHMCDHWNKIQYQLQNSVQFPVSMGKVIFTLRGFWESTETVCRISAAHTAVKHEYQTTTVSKEIRSHLADLPVWSDLKFRVDKLGSYTLSYGATEKTLYFCKIKMGVKYLPSHLPNNFWKEKQTEQKKTCYGNYTN
jgi:hypothetical protein